MKKEQSGEPGPGPRHSSRTRVLFVCIGNACRSPMAEAIARYDAADVIEPSSAGLSPLGYIADLTKQTLMRNGYSVAGLTSDVLTREAADAADIIINMAGELLEENFCQREKVEDWIVQDPFGADPETYQRIFEGIKRRVNQLALGLREEREQQRAAK
ncbi:MAG TPA: low molecular weight phosphatase family protein [Candidatus Acidoferrum sp.]|nr:low molecular weight phosphatase family protein [Candidatus Acidoferrum sp.]